MKYKNKFKLRDCLIKLKPREFFKVIFSVCTGSFLSIMFIFKLSYTISKMIYKNTFNGDMLYALKSNQVLFKTWELFYNSYLTLALIFLISFLIYPVFIKNKKLRFCNIIFNVALIFYTVFTMYTIMQKDISKLFTYITLFIFSFAIYTLLTAIENILKIRGGNSENTKKEG
ncbi:hypothetical protein FL857_10845 [Criibacterium bergeronii]|uniref:Uncharacterized protein n=1 Tax=Criibacterium bergeronii TaxID=1871336 RepID=A0A552UXG2_9FIRM|nr:hypothetical protein [Criibacterium bergeronii]TRW22899.1 hypothetical protein FL857_10845 [Criibacterium bergeronii]